ncbi:DNA repair and recombination protein RAD54B [Nilaparvata lugens]|uniref:DNA repair and recombination protein RAD54B n=1 Tax=Nilaparvata lugens TaxID=108931 RepID=UPI00193E3535|nr:DNA repair and recombination protein RAD54B [Nilaparvata lugens]
MRRSFAPSQKWKPPQSASGASVSGSQSRGRGTSQILQLLNSDSQECENSVETEDSCQLKDDLSPSSQCLESGQVQPTQQDIETKSDSSQETPTSKRYFNVVYGKQSKKKHKTWEGDGVLEVGDAVVVLKDTDGKVLGRASGKKFAKIEEGNQFYVGSKEVEILDEINSQDVTYDKQPLKSNENKTKESCQPPKKRQKTEKFEKMFSCPLKSRTASEASTALMMPRPDHDHQWKFNTENVEVRNVHIDPRLASKLRPHQREGVTFLYRCVVGLRSGDHLGAILADEMGLGKTLQTITLVWTLFKQGPYGVPLLKRVLIVTPSSLLGNWNNEFQRWLGRERIHVYVVDQKNKFVDYEKQPRTPVIIISYEMFVRCHADVCKYKFDLVICDEGHRLKNNAIKASTLLNNIDCKRRIILTGTPIQNNLQEFHALVDFVNPSILGTYSEFLIAVVYCLQKLLYEAAVDFWEKRLEKESASNPVSHLSVLIQLKKISNHPFLIYEDFEGEDSNTEETKNDVRKHLASTLDSNGGTCEGDSSKLNVLATLLENLRNSREKVVVVSYYKQTLDLIAAFCEQKQFAYSRLDGSTPSTQRTNIIANFNSSACTHSVFLLSGKAGGTGLNLVGASRLVLFDSDWNPASDQQAMARIWRDGQSKSVHIYRLLTTGSVEEKIFQRQLSKASLGETVVDFVASNSTVRLSNKELKELFIIQDSLCFTHDLMECTCKGDGVVEDKENDELRIDESQLNLQTAKKTANANLKMNQLFHWEHHCSPFNSTLLKEMGLEKADNFISFVFRNTTS